MPPSKGVRVLYLPVNGKAEYREIANDLASLVELVGDGFLEMVPLTKELVMFCDESGTDRGLPHNFTIRGHFVRGDAFFARREGGQVVSLSDEDVALLLSIGAEPAGGDT